MLRSLHLKDVGPAPELNFEFAPRLNLLTGDNGLGKSFVLDVIWFLISMSWSSERAFPFRPRPNGSPARATESAITARFAHRSGSDEFEPVTFFGYDRLGQVWRRNWDPGRLTAGFSVDSRTTDEAQLRPKSLVVYARSDGGISVWDSYRATARIAEFGKAAVQLTQTELWYGKRTKDPEGSADRVVCKGLIDDWVFWRNENSTAWSFLRRALAALSPPKEDLVPGEPVALRLDEDRLIPTLELPYGVVPVSLASAGMQRILGIAYAIVWAWTRHLQAAEGAGVSPTKDLVVLIDEVEAHLHPNWQRVILPALLKAIGAIAPNVAVQAFVSTHAPLVLASIESTYREALDDLFHFQLDGTVISAHELPFAKQGDAGHWLVSEAFGLQRSRSIEGELAIEAALAFMRGDHDGAKAELARLRAVTGEKPSRKALKTRVHEALVAHVPPHDRFWPRWIVSYESDGHVRTNREPSK